MNRVKFICKGSTIENEKELLNLGFTGNTKIVEVERIVDEMISKIKSDQLVLFRDSFIGLDTLIIQNVHRVSKKTGTQSEIVRAVRMIPKVIFTSLYSEDEILNSEDDVYSRDMKDLITCSYS